MSQEETPKQPETQEQPPLMSRRKALTLMAATSAVGTGLASTLSGIPRGIVDEANKTGTKPGYFPETLQNMDTAGKVFGATLASGTALSIVGDKEPGNSRRSFFKVAATGGAYLAGNSIGRSIGESDQKDWIKETGGISREEYWKRRHQKIIDDASKEIKRIKEDTKRLEEQHQQVMDLIKKREEEEALIPPSTPNNVETRPSYESAVERLEAETKPSSPNTAPAR